MANNSTNTIKNTFRSVSQVAAVDFGDMTAAELLEMQLSPQKKIRLPRKLGRLCNVPGHEHVNKRGRATGKTMREGRSGVCCKCKAMRNSSTEQMRKLAYNIRALTQKALDGEITRAQLVDPLRLALEIMPVLSKCVGTEYDIKMQIKSGAKAARAAKATNAKPKASKQRTRGGFITVKDAAKIAGVSVTRIYQLKSSGKLSHKKLNGKIVVSKSDLRATMA